MSGFLVPEEFSSVIENMPPILYGRPIQIILGLETPKNIRFRWLNYIENIRWHRD